MTRILVILVLTTAALPALAQQNLPKASGNPLQDICTGFMEQSGQAVAGDPNKLCTCLVQETQRRLTKDEMQAYAQSTQSGQAPPPAVMEKVVGIATACLSAR